MNFTTHTNKFKRLFLVKNWFSTLALKIHDLLRLNQTQIFDQHMQSTLQCFVYLQFLSALYYKKYSREKDTEESNYESLQNKSWTCRNTFSCK